MGEDQPMADLHCSREIIEHEGKKIAQQFENESMNIIFILFFLISHYNGCKIITTIIIIIAKRKSKNITDI